MNTCYTLAQKCLAGCETYDYKNDIKWHIIDFYAIYGQSKNEKSFQLYPLLYKSASQCAIIAAAFFIIWLFRHIHILKWWKLCLFRHILCVLPFLFYIMFVHTCLDMTLRDGFGKVWLRHQRTQNSAFKISLKWFIR